MARQWSPDTPFSERARILREEKAYAAAEQEREREEREASEASRLRAAQERGDPLRPETAEEERQRALKYQLEVPSAGEGGRYDACKSLCGKLAAALFSYDASWAALGAYGSRCEPPLPVSELHKLTLDKYLASIVAPRTRMVPVGAGQARRQPRGRKAPAQNQPPAEDPSGVPVVTESEATPAEQSKFADRGDWAHAVALWQLASDRLRWTFHRKSWMEFTGKFWEPVPDTRALAMASESLRTHYIAEINAPSSPEDFKRLSRLITQTCQTRYMSNALRFYAGEYPVLVLYADDWDADPYLLNCDNGTLDLQTHELHPHDAGDLFTRCTNTPYDPTARCPKWEAHLARFLPNPSIRRQVLRDLGRALIGTTVAESLPIWYGTGANGKSTTIRTVAGVLGKYATNAPMNLLVEKRHEDHPAGVAELIGARLVFAIEADRRAQLSETLVTNLTGGDRIKTRYLYGNPFEAECTFSIFLIGNHKPGIRAITEGIWRRINLTPWDYQIPPTERRPQDEVIHDLLSEAPGILNSLLYGLRDWQSDHSWTAPEVLASTSQYRQDEDTIATFLEDCTSPDPNGQIPVGELYDLYVRWSGAASAMGKKTLSNVLAEKGFTQSRNYRASTRVWNGITRIERDPDL